MRQKKFLFLLVLLCAVTQGAWAQVYNKWDGKTKSKPTQRYNIPGTDHRLRITICSAAELAYICEHWDDDCGWEYVKPGTVGNLVTTGYDLDFSEMDYVLNTDIDMGDYEWIPLGRISSTITRYNCKFDGQGHTIRINIKDATKNYQGLFAAIGSEGRVENLHVTGNIHCKDSRLVGGIAGENDGVISNCWVSADVSSDWHESGSSYKAKVGGICGENNGTVEYCCMSGNVKNNDAHVGGLVGCNDEVVKHCTFYGNVSSSHSQHDKYVGTDNTEEDLHDKFSDSELASHLGSFSGNDMYRTGLQYPFTVTVDNIGEGNMVSNATNIFKSQRARPGQTVRLTKTSGPQVLQVRVKGATGFEFKPDGNETDGYTFTMLGSNATVTVYYWGSQWKSRYKGTEDDPYLISTDDEWTLFANDVTNGNDYNGKYVKLANDVNITTMAGLYATGKPFRGIFDGNGKTVTADIAYNYRNGTAPFGYIENATIKNLTVKGRIQSFVGSSDMYSRTVLHTSGLVGYASDTNLIEGCVVNAAIYHYHNFAAGFVGHGLKSTTTIRNCRFTGAFHISDTGDYIAAFWGWDDGATVKLENCKEWGGYDNAGGSHPMGFNLKSDVYTECYFVNKAYDGREYDFEGDAYQLTKRLPVDEICKPVMFDEERQLYTLPCTFGGVEKTYDLRTESSISITPTLTAVNGSQLVLGTDFTAKLNGEPVETFPVTIDKGGSYMLTLYAKDSYEGVKSAHFTVLGAEIAGEGSEENPYIINSDADWTRFAHNVSEGNEYTGKYVKLEANITVRTMVGSDIGKYIDPANDYSQDDDEYQDDEGQEPVIEGYCFAGTFDGGGHTLTLEIGDAEGPFAEDFCAPFRCVKNATIRNLKTKGFIYTSAMYAAGVVGSAKGADGTRIENCHSAIVIHSSLQGEGGHGGIMGVAKSGDWPYDQVIITGCVYSGRLFTTNGTNGTTRCGGLMGHASGIARIKIDQSLYAPDTTIEPAEGETAINHQSTIARLTDLPFDIFQLTGSSYYTEPLGQRQHTQVFAINAGDDITVANAGEVKQEYDVSRLTFYDKGMKYGDVLYAAKDEEVSLTLSHNRQNYNADYRADGGTLAGTENPYTLTMPEANVTISAVWKSQHDGEEGTEEKPYLIKNDDEWAEFVSYVNQGYSFEGEFVKLTTDISVSAKCGTATSASNLGNAFSGTFDGDGHTITAAITDTDNEGTALFNSIDGATIKNLTVAGTISGGDYAAAIVGFAKGAGRPATEETLGSSKNSIENCVASASVSGGTHVGGLLGHALDSDISISTCVFSGKLTGGDTAKGIFCGWGSEGGNKTVSYCLYRMADGQDTANLDLVQKGEGDINVDDCYKTNSAGIYGTLVYTDAAEGEIYMTAVAPDENTYYMLCEVSSVDNSHYTGSELSVAPVVTAANGMKLAPGVDYTFSTDRTVQERGTYTLTIAGTNHYEETEDYNGTGYYTGTKTVDFTVSGLAGEGTEDEPYTIRNTDDWNAFASLLAEGSIKRDNIVLTQDIEVSTMVGSGANHAFRGTFDGGGHTLTVSVGTEGEPFAAEFCGPFRYTYGATIKNLHTAGHIYTSSRYAGGVVGRNGTNSTALEGVTSDVAIHSSYNGGQGAYHGGLMGYAINASFTGCAFTGSLLGTDSHHCGGLLGQKSSTENSNASFTHCLFAPAEVTVSPTASYTFAAASASLTTFDGSYYTQALGTAQGSQACAFKTAPDWLGDLVKDYGTMKAYANGILYGDTYYVAPVVTISLANDEDNTTAINDAKGFVANVTLADRTLYKDGNWNTLCLPFDVTLDGSPLEGATACPLSEASISGSTLNLNFGQAVDQLKAGTPYIIKWNTADATIPDASASGTDDLVAPLFNGVTIDATDRSYDNGVSGAERVRFLGTYKGTTFSAEDKSILFMGGENTLYYPLAKAEIGAQRAYFKIGDDGTQEGVRRLTAFNISFGDDASQGIIAIEDGRAKMEDEAGAWYTLDGRRLSGKPAQSGVYVKNGKKMVIK